MTQHVFYKPELKTPNRHFRNEKEIGAEMIPAAQAAQTHVTREGCNVKHTIG